MADNRPAVATSVPAETAVLSHLHLWLGVRLVLAPGLLLTPRAGASLQW